MINIVDQALKAYLSVIPTLFVDDLSAESVAGERHIRCNLVGFVNMVCDRIKADGMEVSATKSVSTASGEGLGQELADQLAHHGVSFKMRNKSLGSGLGSGVRRNATVINLRLKRFRQRVGRYRLLRKARVDTSRVLRTGGVAALTFGQAAMGTPPCTLLGQRRAVAAAAAPSCSVSGHNLDLALMIADGSATGRVDPAFEAHAGPIGHWAQAVWNGWLPMKHLQQLVDSARARVTKAAHPWRVVYGPAAALICTATRLQWTVYDAVSFSTDDGKKLRLDLDPPSVIVKAVHAAVRRWRWRAIEGAHHSLSSAGAGRGAVMEPIWKLLRSQDNTAAWSPGMRGALRSAIANRQWPQARCFQAGFASHPKCLFCVHGAINDTVRDASLKPALQMDSSALAASEARQPAARPVVEPFLPTQCQIDGAPAGTSFHWIWKCPRLEMSRRQYAPEGMRLRACAEELAGDVAFERALFPSLDALVPPPSAVDSFTWVVYPEGGLVCGKVYTDGSRLDGPSELLARNGWSFVALDTEGKITAASNGVPPNWITVIPGAEAWALFQAASRAEPGTQYRVDCQPCVNAFHNGRAAATKDNRPLARVHNLMCAALDDTDVAAVVWMPAHTKKEDVGRVYLGDGSKLTDLDRKGNEEADRLAKLAVEAHRVPKQVRDKIKELDLVVERAARWVARATYAAGNQIVQPFRDTDASRVAAVTAARGRMLAKRGERGQVETVRPVEFGGRVAARRAKDKARRAPKWPIRGAAGRRCCGGQRGRKRCNVEIQRLPPRTLTPLVHPLTASERKAALLQRVRAKEAAMRATARSDAVVASGAVEVVAVRQRFSGKRPHGVQRGPDAGEVGAASKRQRTTTGDE